ncbi:MAG: DUF359 domain-containing protein [Thermoprotei archaeon]
MKLPVLILPNIFRKNLSIPLSTLYVSPYKGVVKGFRVEFSVGDIVSRNHHSRVKVIDFKTLRKEKKRPIPHETGTIYLLNPRGTLSLNAFTMLKAVGSNTGCVIVKGEEDLVVLPIGFEYNSSIVYGQPNTGVVFLQKGFSRYYAQNIIKLFKPAIIDYAVG